MNKQLTLREALSITGDNHQTLDSGAIQVFSLGAKLYYFCADYAVSSAVSGPSLVMVPRESERGTT